MRIFLKSFWNEGAKVGPFRNHLLMNCYDYGEIGDDSEFDWMDFLK